MKKFNIIFLTLGLLAVSCDNKETKPSADKAQNNAEYSNKKPLEVKPDTVTALRVTPINRTYRMAQHVGSYVTEVGKCILLSNGIVLKIFLTTDYKLTSLHEKAFISEGDELVMLADSLGNYHLQENLTLQEKFEKAREK